MSTASVTSPMRAHGWNVHFLAAPAGSNFAGLFRRDGFDITYRDVLAEMRLCFDIPDDRFQAYGQPSSQDLPVDPWDNLAFGFVDFINLPRDEASASHAPSNPVMTSTGLDQVVILPPTFSTNPGEQPIIRFHLVQHRSCDLPSTASLASHLKAGCAQHIPRPVRRRDARYLPPKKPSHDAQITRLPLRKRAAVRRSSQSPSKRSASGSASPNKNSESSQLPINEEEDFTNMVAPPDMDIAADVGRQTIAGFRSSCLIAARQCAVSGEGRSWCISPAVGPALQACHIIPQQHYHLYPDPEGLNNTDSIELSPQRLQEAWQRTWSAKNGILLLSHLHELFDSRLFSIHPETLQIRAFVPYDVICKYHGLTAIVPSNVDRNALRHHYDMCCIENMAAEMPLMDQISKIELPASGMTSPFNTKATFPSISTPTESLEQPHSRDINQSTQRTRGDPSKRPRPENDDLTPGVYEESEDGRSIFNESDESSCEHKPKRRRVVGQRFKKSSWDHDENTNPRQTYGSYITPPTLQWFLDDGNRKWRSSA
ncbi:hypothetical protein V8C37DRAFT_366959 [Trichoderma ceciliae]